MTNPKKPLAFVAGATGYTGLAVVRALRERGIATIAHVRPDSSRLDQWRAMLTELGAQVDTTAWDEAALTATLSARQPTLVFALLGTTRARKKKTARAGEDPATATYRAVDYGLTALLIRAAVASGAQPRCVYLSAVGVSPSAKGEYYRARVDAEVDLIASGLPYVIARPSFITGPDRLEDRPSERVGAAVIDGALAVVGGLGLRSVRDRYRSLTGPQLGVALVALALDDAAVDGIFETAQLRARSNH